MKRFNSRKLIHMRLSKGLSQRELASYLETTGVTVSRWERGEVEPTPFNIAKIAEFFEVQPYSMYDDSVSVLSFNSNIPVYALSNGKKEELGLIGVPDSFNLDFALIADDSIEPEIREGTYLWFRKSQKPEHNKIFLVRVNEKFYLRKCVKIDGEYKFIPNREGYESFSCVDEIVGKLSKEMVDKE